MFFKKPLADAVTTLNDLPLRPALPLPPGVSRNALFEWLKSVRVQDAPDSIVQYCIQDFERFVHTYGLVQRALPSTAQPKGLELGANPYFTTMLLKRYTAVEWSLANYFGPSMGKGRASQTVFFDDPQEKVRRQVVLDYAHFNIEEDRFPFDDGSFDIVLFCEIIEHLLNDPCAVLREIRRVLRDNGTLVLTTPNVSRLENVARMIAGVNIYDPYSAYGPYGRHNREYNKHELHLLLDYLGFRIEEMFTADVHHNAAAGYYPIPALGELVRNRRHDLGQYIFVRARKDGADRGKKPAWLYRSYPEDCLE